MIINKQKLLRTGTCVKGRRFILGALEAALSAADPKVLLGCKVKLKGETLQIMDERYFLNDFHSVHVIGAGKASGYMAEALHDILRDRITDGFVIVPDNLRAKLRTGKIRLWKARHPIPNYTGVRGVKQMLETVEKVTEHDLVICLISGGGSALMPLPYGDLTLSDKQKVTDDLLRSGADIVEINTVRKHLSAIKGGRLAERLREAHVASLLISDVVGDRLDTIASGPTAPDGTTFSDAAHVLKKYGLWNSSVKARRLIEKGMAGAIPETPKPGSRIFRNVRNFMIANNRLACEAALKHLKTKAIDAIILTTFLQGEAREVGAIVASLAEEMKNRQLGKPVALIMGGETTVKVSGKGKGGRNQELVLAAARGISELGNTTVASIDTDGIDGNSDAAGAIADMFTMKRAKQLKLDPEKFLDNNDSYSFFNRICDVIQTGPTGTNVNDVLILLCM